MEQFEINRLLKLDLFGLDASFTNSSLFMVLAVVLIIGFLNYAMGGRALIPTGMKDSYNFDDDPSSWVANYQEESFALYENVKNGFFRHVSVRTGIESLGSLFVGFGTTFLDLGEFQRDVGL